jgi:hypothetical protein
MQLQGRFSQAEYAGKKKQTRRDKFLAEMEQVVPWARLVERLRPLYPKGERGRPPIGLERMLRIHFLQQWYGLADGAMEDALYDSQALRGFAGIDLTVAAVPEETTILNFRHWLERHELSRALFAEVSAMLEERGLLMRQSLPRRRPGAQSLMRPSSPPRPRPKTRAKPAIRRCTRPRKAISGISGSGISGSGISGSGISG